jgi:hypothetical protein
MEHDATLAFYKVLAEISEHTQRIAHALEFNAKNQESQTKSLKDIAWSIDCINRHIRQGKCR